MDCRGLETYTAMFCRRCFKYDCDFHGIYHPQSCIKDSPAGNRPPNLSQPIPTYPSLSLRMLTYAGKPPERRAAGKREAAERSAAAAAATHRDKKDSRDKGSNESIDQRYSIYLFY